MAVRKICYIAAEAAQSGGLQIYFPQMGIRRLQKLRKRARIVSSQQIMTSTKTYKLLEIETCPDCSQSGRDAGSASAVHSQGHDSITKEQPHRSNLRLRYPRLTFIALANSVTAPVGSLRHMLDASIIPGQPTHHHVKFQRVRSSFRTM
jgi:hypothetical protein